MTVIGRYYERYADHASRSAARGVHRHRRSPRALCTRTRDPHGLTSRRILPIAWIKLA